MDKPVSENRPTFTEFKRKALSDPAITAKYQALSAVFDKKRQMIAMRKLAELKLENFRAQ